MDQHCTAATAAEFVLRNAVLGHMLPKHGRGACPCRVLPASRQGDAQAGKLIVCAHRKRMTPRQDTGNVKKVQMAEEQCELIASAKHN